MQEFKQARRRQEGEQADPDLEKEGLFQITDEEYEAIHLVDFRVNNIQIPWQQMFVALVQNPADEQASEMVMRFDRFLRTHITSVDKGLSLIAASTRPEIQELDALSQKSRLLLIDMLGVIHTLNRLVRADTKDVWKIEEAAHFAGVTWPSVIKKYQDSITAFGHTVAYGAYRRYVKEHDLEASRNTLG